MVLKDASLKLLQACSIVIYAFAAVFIMAAIALNLSFMSPVAQTMRDFSLTDIYYHILRDYGHVDTSRVITIVDMTRLHDRADIADVLENIQSMNPKVVGVDIVFEGTKTDTMADLRIMDVAASCRNTVFSYRLKDYANESIGYERDIHSFFTDMVNVEEGFTNFERLLYGGLKRKVAIKDKCMGEERISLAYKIAQLYSDNTLAPHEESFMNVNFRSTEFHVIPYDSVTYHRDWIEGHIVLYGAEDELSDMHYTPLGEMAGVELLAYSIQTLLEQSEVRNLSNTTTGVLTFFLSLITCLIRLKYVEWARARKNEWMRFFLTTSFVIGWLLFSWTAFLTYCAFLTFVWTNINFNLGWTMAVIPFFYGAGEFYEITVRRLVDRFSSSKK